MVQGKVGNHRSLATSAIQRLRYAKYNRIRGSFFSLLFHSFIRGDSAARSPSRTHPPSPPPAPAPMPRSTPPGTAPHVPRVSRTLRSSKDVSVDKVGARRGGGRLRSRGFTADRAAGRSGGWWRAMGGRVIRATVLGLLGRKGRGLGFGFSEVSGHAGDVRIENDSVPLDSSFGRGTTVRSGR